MVESAMSSSTIYALESDLRARGIGSEKMISGINLVGYDGFVELAVTNDKVQSWL
jgi:tRNA 2-thiouridine synthesizing protein B